MDAVKDEIEERINYCSKVQRNTMKAESVIIFSERRNFQVHTRKNGDVGFAK